MITSPARYCRSLSMILYIIGSCHNIVQGRSQVLGFGGEIYFQGDNIFAFVICLKQNFPGATKFGGA